MTGGEAVEAVRNAAMAAAEEAESGGWLEDFEAGLPMTNSAPGLSALVFADPQPPSPTESFGMCLCTF